MAKQRPVALVFAGPVSRGSLGRLPGLRQHLAWVKSSSVATASRAIHALHHGRAVASYAEIEDAALILISVPDRAVDSAVTALCASELTWPNKTVVLFDSRRDSSALSTLAQFGAETATLLYHPRPEQFLAEGTPEALRALRPLTGKVPLLLLRDREEYYRALKLTTEEFYPVFAGAIKAFRDAGMSKLDAERTTAAMIADSARTFLRAGSRILKRGPPKRRA